MKIYYDEQKNAQNIASRGLSFASAKDFKWETARFLRDERKDYPETRFVGVGYLDQRLHVICFTPLEDGVRVISFRKANEREIKRYEKA